MAVINPSDLTFSGEEIRSFAEAIIEQMVDYPSINDQALVIPGIITKRQIAILGHLSKITRKDLGCGLGKLDKTIKMSEKFWDPVNLKIWLSECWTQFENTFMVYYLNVGGEKSDLTTTEIFSNWLVEEVGQAATNDATRIAWFGDKQAAKVADGGVFSDDPELNILDYSMLDGLWKQIFAIVTANPARRVTIAKNAAATYALQQFDETDIANKTVTKIFTQLIFKADRRLRSRPDKMIWATRSLTDQYLLERLDFPTIELAYTRLESGIDTLPILGVTVLVMDQWDDVIQSDQDNGTKFNLPHRAYFGVKKNTQIGFDSEAAVTEFDVFYDKMTETSNIKGLYKMDTKIVEDYLVQAAY